MKTILTSFDSMQNFDFILFLCKILILIDLKNLAKQTPEHLKRTLVHVWSRSKVLKKF